jgi:nitrogen-specific signal transduction histidine kinase
MRNALVVSQRGKLLKSLLGVIGDPELDVEVRPDLVGALPELRRVQPSLLVLDLATIEPRERGLLPTLRSQSPRSALLAVVPATAPELIREAMRAHVHGVLLDPFDLAETKAVIDRLLDSAHTRTGEQESIDQLAVFLRGIAHEILNPLTSISGLLQVLTQEEGDSKERTGRYRTMLQSVERIQKVLRELEYFVRARKPQRRRLDPVKLVRGVADRLRQSDPPVAVKVDAPESAPPILADPEQLALALRHLGSFAAGKNRDGPVEIALRPSAERLEIDVSGIVAVPMGDRPEQLLVPYQDVTASGRSGNLELSAAHGIVRSHKGTLDVSVPSTGGIRFRVALPLPQAAGGEDEAAPAGV